MNSWIRSRNGNRNLLQPLSHGLGRRTFRYATTMLGGARRPPRPNYLVQLCRVLSQYLRISKRMAKRDPHLFGPHAQRYYLDTLALEKRKQETQAALRKIYGPPKPGEPVRTSTLWTDRYAYPDQSPRNRRMFLKWFKQDYP